MRTNDSDGEQSPVEIDPPECRRPGHDCDGRGCGCPPDDIDCDCLVCADYRADNLAGVGAGGDDS